MKKLPSFPSFASFLLFVASLHGLASGGEPLKILVFGNSYSHCIIEELPKFAREAGERPVEVRCLRAAGLEKYWASISAGEREPESMQAKVALETDYKARVSTVEEIRRTKWDVIVIQNLSVVSPGIKAWRPHAKNIFEYCKKYSPDARFVVYQTHAYRDDSIKFKGSANLNFREPYSEDEMYADVRNCVIDVAKELKIEVVPVGDAFQIARKSPLWGNAFPDSQFDYTNAVFPEKPNEYHSLHIGFKWVDGQKKTKKAYRIDCHPNAAGRYLGGAVFYEVLFGKNVESVKYTPENRVEELEQKTGAETDAKASADEPLTDTSATALRTIAHEAVEAFKKQHSSLIP